MGKSIDENPQVSSLITGIFKQRPLQSRCTCVWDAQLVLNYLKKHLPDNKKSTNRQLTLILLALTSASPAGGLHRYKIYGKN